MGGSATSPLTSTPILLEIFGTKVDFLSIFHKNTNFGHMDGPVPLVDSRNRLGGDCIYVHPTTGCRVDGVASGIGGVLVDRV